MKTYWVIYTYDQTRSNGDTYQREESYILERENTEDLALWWDQHKYEKSKPLCGNTFGNFKLTFSEEIEQNGELINYFLDTHHNIVYTC